MSTTFPLTPTPLPPPLPLPSRNPHNVKALDAVLTYHVHAGAVKSNQIKNGEKITTLDAETVTATVGGGAVKINQATVIKADVLASNGVVHLIDAVLVPTNFALPKDDIVQTAEAVATLSTLVKAVVAGDLAKTLSMPNGPYTVFAPSDAAFAKIPANVLAYLLAHPKELDNVLLYHVLGHRVYAAQIKDYSFEETIQGEFLIFLTNSTGVYVNGDALVTVADVDCTNGVVHVIDTVLLPRQAMARLEKDASAWAKVNPKNLPNIVQLAASDPDLSTLVTAVTAGGLVSVLSGAGPFTVFAPTNQAFLELPHGVLDFLLNPANIKSLDAVLTYHVVSGAVYSRDLKDGEVVPTVEGANVTVHIDQRAQVFIDYGMVVKADLAASNGVVHIIDAVLLPGARAAAPAVAAPKKSLRA